MKITIIASFFGVIKLLTDLSLRKEEAAADSTKAFSVDEFDVAGKYFCVFIAELKLLINYLYNDN